jgi:hypothetical protein
VASEGNPIDRATQYWVKRTGRPINFAEHPWLRGPIGRPGEASGEWLKREAESLGGRSVDGGGLLGQINLLGGDGFAPDCVAGPIVDFYEQTSEWRMKAQCHWSPGAWPFAQLLSSAFAQRLAQFDLPIRAGAATYGINSRIVTVRDDGDSQTGAAWLRTLHSTGQTIYTGWYGVVTLPSADRPSLRVVFPLPNGSVTVFLHPSVRPDGSLALRSPIGPFGTDGTYLVVAGAGQSTGWARRIPLVEEFLVSASQDGTLRTVHELSIWSLPVFKLDYRLQRS